MKIFSKKGSALLQVLVVSVIMALMAALLLRLSSSRAGTVVRTTALVTAEAAVQGCQQQINQIFTCLGNDYLNPPDGAAPPGFCTTDAMRINILTVVWSAAMFDPLTYVPVADSASFIAENPEHNFGSSTVNNKRYEEGLTQIAGLDPPVGEYVCNQIGVFQGRQVNVVARSVNGRLVFTVDPANIELVL